MISSRQVNYREVQVAAIITTHEARRHHSRSTYRKVQRARGVLWPAGLRGCHQAGPQLLRLAWPTGTANSQYSIKNKIKTVNQ
jgi:hypothetical protein